MSENFRITTEELRELIEESEVYKILSDLLSGSYTTGKEISEILGYVLDIENVKKFSRSQGIPSKGGDLETKNRYTVDKLESNFWTKTIESKNYSKLYKKDFD